MSYPTLGLLFLLVTWVAAQSDVSGPVFVQEPPNQVDFSNTTGAEVICQSRGTPLPRIKWVKTDGTVIKDVPGLRQVLDTGNLILTPFRAEDYNQEVHAQTYRCIAENTFGKIQSRDVHVRAGTAENFFTNLAGNGNFFTTLKKNSKNFSYTFLAHQKLFRHRKH
jgi:hypothetical protein